MEFVTMSSEQRAEFSTMFLKCYDVFIDFCIPTTIEQHDNIIADVFDLVRE